MEIVIENEATLNPSSMASAYMTSTATGLSKSSTKNEDDEEEAIRSPVPKSSVPEATDTDNANPDQIQRSLTSKTEEVTSRQDEVVAVLNQLHLLNGPPGQQIFTLLDQLLQDWSTVVDNLAKAEGRFARDRNLSLKPQHVIQACLTAFKQLERPTATLDALSDMAFMVEDMFARAEGFVRKSSDNPDANTDEFSNPEAAVPDDNDNRNRSEFPLFLQQLKIIKDVSDRAQALSTRLKDKIYQLQGVHVYPEGV